MTPCSPIAPRSRQRTFWTTQLNACGEENHCGADCASPWLALTDENEAGQRSIVNTEWLRGLILNILMTDGRKPNTRCGYRLLAQGGHWSDSFRNDGQTAGSLVRFTPPARSVRENAQQIRVALMASLAKLTTGTPKLASSVEVSVEYVGSGNMRADITIVEPTGVRKTVGLTGARSDAAWVWQ